ncbi:WD40/YVTN/BNR-like repeat-containing protein [Zhongshania aliphaticivorans]|nr:YCF48-related protein [Zhongshania aliphaticivorans]
MSLINTLLFKPCSALGVDVDVIAKLVRCGMGLLVITVIGAANAAPLQGQLVNRGHAHEALFAVNASSEGLIAVGGGGQISTSKDGENWTRLDIDLAGKSLLAVSDLAGNAIAVGQQGVIVRRDGSGWHEQTSPTTERLFSVAQDGEGFVIASGGFGTVLRSVDGGIHWEKLAIDWQALIGQSYEPHVYNVTVDDRGRAYMVGEFGMIARSDDQGLTWQALHSGDESLFGFSLGVDGLAYAVGQSGTILRSRDAGLNWEKISSGSEAILLDVSIRSDGRAVVTGIREGLSIGAEDSKATRLEDSPLLVSWYCDVSVYKGDFYVVGEKANVIKLSI